jgi:hypothetical protein
MRKGKRILLAGLLVAALCGFAWLVLRPHSGVFRGKPESEWIKSITYNGNDAQTQQWREFGPDGLRLLAKTLNQGRIYRKIYRWTMPRLPGALNHILYPRLPNPMDSHSTRMCVIALLSSLGKDAKLVEPAIARALDDDDGGVRLSALGCYEGRLLEVIGKKEKAARLPSFVRAMQDREWAVRNNAAVALWFYQDQAQAVVPVLVKALQDPDAHVRLLSAKDLVHIDSKAGIEAGIVPILIDILKSPDDQVAYQAAESLGELGNASVLVVPALVESVHGTNRLVAQTAARALKKIDPEAAARAGVK